MSDGAVINLCRILISEKEKDQEIRLAAEHFLTNFDVLTENRNIAMHSLAYQEGDGGFTFAKRTKKGTALKITILPEELELCCKELKQLFHFGMTVQGNFYNRRAGERRVKLLPAPPTPRKLHLRQLVQDSDLPPPQSSGA
jgi:hypothetical protein